jgi:hypothetical protein
MRLDYGMTKHISVRSSPVKHLLADPIAGVETVLINAWPKRKGQASLTSSAFKHLSLLKARKHEQTSSTQSWRLIYRKMCKITMLPFKTGHPQSKGPATYPVLEDLGTTLLFTLQCPPWSHLVFGGVFTNCLSEYCLSLGTCLSF